MKKLLAVLGILSVVAIALVTGVAARPTDAADHLDAPAVMNDGRTDINDLYAFQSPGQPDRTVMIMTVNPLAGVQNPTTFKPLAAYQFQVDNDGDAKEELTYTIRFGLPRSNGKQRVTLTANGRIKALGWTGEDISVKGGGKLRADIFDDPFFFDLVAFRNGLAFCPGNTGVDFFAGLNVTAIVLEVPSSALGDNNVGIWARTRLIKQIDRMGRPAINTVFIPSGTKDAFNAGVPKKDQRDFRDEVVATLLALGNDQATADGLADFLLPDILTIDTSNPAGFPNGRGVADDVIDTELSLITGGAVPSDCVDANDVAFPGAFPYLASPQ